MPKNKLGGNKAKRGKNYTPERTFILKEPDQEYATVIKTLGDGRFQLECKDGINRLGLVRGKMRKRVWVNEGDIVLVGLRDYEDNKADIIHKYTQDEAKKLVNIKEIEKIEENIVEECSFNFDEI